MKRTMKKIRNKDNYVKWAKTICVSLITGALGFSIGWFFEGKVVLSLIVFSILAVIAIILGLFSIVYEKKVSILSILKDNMAKGKYVEAVKLGYPISRALFLAARYDDRYLISEKVCECLEKMDENYIILNEQLENVHLLRIKIKMDDLGWSLYEMNPIEYRHSAEAKVKEALAECIVFNGSEKENEKVYKTIFMGIRHLFGMCVDTFDEEIHLIAKSPRENALRCMRKYEEEVLLYGGVLGYLINDSQIVDCTDKNGFIENVRKLNLGEEKQVELKFMNVLDWIKTSGQGKFMQNTYNFRAKYFLTLARINLLRINMEENDNEELRCTIENYLDKANIYALKMTIGYASQPSNYDWIRNLSFGSNLAEVEKISCSYPDNERYVKGYILLGTIAMQRNNLLVLNDAKKAFQLAVRESRAVNRRDAYCRSQRKLISVEERIFRLKWELKIFNKDVALEELQKLTSYNDQILKETKEYLGAADPKMVKSCKERKASYKHLKKEIINQG